MPPASTRFRLQPANTQRIPFWGQLFIGLIWLGYVLALLVSGEGRSDMHFLHYVFLVFSLVYLGYVLVHNAPIFGTQSYLEFTPAYIVYKNGLFRPKQAFPAESLAGIDLQARQIRLRLKDGSSHLVSMREIRGAKRKRLVIEKAIVFANQHQIPIQQITGTLPRS